MIKAILFDLDGTLMNTLHDLYLSTNFALKKNHFPERSEDEIRQMVGNGVKKLIERALPDNQKDHLEIVLKDFKEHYQCHSLDHTFPYPGIVELLKNLKERQFKLAVISNKFHLAVKEICNRFFKDYLDLAIGESKEIRTKPNPDMINKALQEFDLKKDEVILVGDSETDIETARNAMISIIGVDWGFRGATVLKNLNVDYLVYKPKEIITIVEEINKNDKNLY